MPTHEGDLSIEGHGFEPIPESARYGSVARLFTLWFTPNLAPASFFLGTLAAGIFAAVMLFKEGSSARKSSIPLGPFLAGGAIVVLLFL